MFKMALRANVRKKVADDDSEGESVTQGDATRKGAKRKRAKSTPCEHGVKYRSNCKVCSACPHGRRRYQCKVCNGCPHGRLRSRCGECGVHSASTVVSALGARTAGLDLRARS